MIVSECEGDEESVSKFEWECMSECECLSANVCEGDEVCESLSGSV